jgi:hypothetical protein
VQGIEVDGGGVVLNIGVVLAGEDVAGTAHVGRQLVDLLDTLDDGPDDVWIAQIAEDELVGGRGGEIVRLEIDGANPVVFGFETFNEVAADEATGSIDENAFHGFHKCPKMGLGSFGVLWYFRGTSPR